MNSIIEAGGSEVGKVVKTTVRFLVTLPLLSLPSPVDRRVAALYTLDGLAGRSHTGTRVCMYTCTGLPPLHGRLQARERDLRRVLRGPQARAVCRAGREAPARCALRDRVYRQVRTHSAHAWRNRNRRRTPCSSSVASREHFRREEEKRNGKEKRRNTTSSSQTCAHVKLLGSAVASKLLSIPRRSASTLSLAGTLDVPTRANGVSDAHRILRSVITSVHVTQEGPATCARPFAQIVACMCD